MVSDFAAVLHEALLLVGQEFQFYESIVKMLIAVFHGYPESINIAELIPACASIWSFSTEEEEDEECFAFGSLLGAFMVELGAASAESVDASALGAVLAAFPGDPALSDLPVILNAVLEIATKEWARGPLMVDIALFLSRVVLLSTARLREFQVDAQAYKRAALALKVICRALKEVDAAVMESLEDSKRNLSLLKAIFRRL
jgi:hypothetical protein